MDDERGDKNGSKIAGEWQLPASERQPKAGAGGKYVPRTRDKRLASIRRTQCWVALTHLSPQRAALDTSCRRTSRAQRCLRPLHSREDPPFYASCIAVSGQLMKEHALRNPRGQRTVEGKGRINTTALRLLEHTRRENCRHSWPYLNNYKYIKSHLHRTPTNAPLSSTLSSIVVETKTYHHHVMSSARPPVHISRKFREPEKEKKRLC